MRDNDRLRSRWLPLLASTSTVGVLASSAGCEASPDDAREAQLTAVLAMADEPFIRSRPALSAGKYTRMAYGLYDFYRGTLPLFRNDMRTGTTVLAASEHGLDMPLVPTLGDPHPENFGVLRALDGSVSLEANDFDAADRAPYLWDVRRLATGIALAARVSNPEHEAARERATAARPEIVRGAMASYASAIARLAGAEAELTGASTPSPIVQDLFRRSDKDHKERAELDELTVIEGGVRRFRRGPLDPEDPESVFADLPASALDALPSALAAYRATLLRPPPGEELTVLDAVREFGSGIASWPRVRAIVLVRGPSDDPADDLLLEVKELTDSGIAGLFPPGVYHDSIGQRVVFRAREAWTRPDAEPFWGYTTWLGLPCQIRLETEGQKGIKVDRLEKELGTPEALTSLGIELAAIVARAHAGGPAGLDQAAAIHARIGANATHFIEEQVAVGIAYAELVEEDHTRFVRSLRTRGLRLGIPPDPADRPSPDLASLFGTPPAVPPLPPIAPPPAPIAPTTDR